MTAQIFAVIIFVLMFVLIVMDKIERHYVTLGCGALTLVVVFGICMRSGKAIWDTLAIKGFATKEFWYQVTESESKGINWATIIFIAGMMVMVEGMAKAGFFRWLCMKIAFMVKCRKRCMLGLRPHLRLRQDKRRLQKLRRTRRWKRSLIRINHRCS